MIVGVDEAGRGPLAGAVVSCALSLKTSPPFKPRDSKELKAHQREDMFEWLKNNSMFSVAIANPCEIERLNILQATFLAFERAINSLVEKYPHLKKANFIIDGNSFNTRVKIKYVCMEKADKTVAEVCCASVVAKVTRDNLMNYLDFLYPVWGFARHKGYPTKEHRCLIKQHPLTPFHRKSFSPCSGTG
jgi:ribonuclease HII